jgi:hypothetical protein
VPEPTYPTDIPWKLLTTSQDMMDSSAGDRRFPPKWRSSLAFFYYEPKLDAEAFKGRRIVYLKVVCSITGYQIDNKELGTFVRSPGELTLEPYWDIYNMAQTYHPCYGAMLHLAVFPHQEDDPENMPHIIDFEPKKREMVETVTETGQAMSTSARNLKVNKGGTSTQSQETVRKYEGGWSFNVGGGHKYVKGSAGVSSKYETGYTTGSQSQLINMREINASREAQETQSHTTQLEQMYHLLDTYHMGTNRALFVVTARPHIVDQELSVTNGPRRLEGMQEFFLVVSLPEESTGLRVAGQLETSHLHKFMRPRYTAQHPKGQDHFSQQIDETNRFNFEERRRQKTETFHINVPDPESNIIDRNRGQGGYSEKELRRDHIKSHQVIVHDDHIEVKVVFLLDEPDLDGGDLFESATFHYEYTLYYKARLPEWFQEWVDDAYLFLMGRYLEGRWKFERDPEGSFERPEGWYDQYVVSEEKLPKWVSKILGEVSNPNITPERMGQLRKELNDLQCLMKERSMASVNSPNRYPAGEHSFLDTDFVNLALRMVSSEGDFNNKDYETPIKIDDRIAGKIRNEKVANRLKKYTVSDLISCRSSELSHWTGLSVKDCMELKKENIGLTKLKG